MLLKFSLTSTTRKHIPGFTLIEILLTMAIAGVVSSLAVPFTFRQLSENRVINASAEMNGNIFRYQQYSFANKGNYKYGVKFLEDNYVLFSIPGDTPDIETAGYAERNPDLDEIFLYENRVDIIVDGGDDELTFNRGDFRPDEIISVTLTDGNTEVVVEITTEGLIDYYIFDDD